VWQARYGGISNAAIAAIVNAANTIYERDLGVTLALVELRSASLPPPRDPRNVQQWLSQFQTYAAETMANQGYDATFLFSGRKFSPNVLGIAYLGSVCRSPPHSRRD